MVVRDSDADCRMKTDLGGSGLGCGVSDEVAGYGWGLTSVFRDSDAGYRMKFELRLSINKISWDLVWSRAMVEAIVGGTRAMVEFLLRRAGVVRGRWLMV